MVKYSSTEYTAVLIVNCGVRTPHAKPNIEEYIMVPAHMSRYSTK